MSDGSLSVLKGTLDLLILRTLGGSEEMHGFEILDWIEESTGGSLAVEEGALYPALHRLESKGWIEGQWGISSKGRRAKYYRISKQGRRALRKQERAWARYVAVMDSVSAAGGGDG